MSLYTYLLVVVALALGIIVGSANAAPLVQVDLVESGPKSTYVSILGALDNQNGTTSLMLDVCDSIYVFTVENSKIETHENEINEFIGRKIEEICQ